MKRLGKIVRSATPSTGVQFRPSEYGSAGARDFLRDIIALANAPVEGQRYIIVGAEIDAKGRKLLREVDREDFTGNPSYQALANEFIEPPVRIKYQPVMVDGKRVGVYEIGDCQDRPYMMRVDHSETLRRGDAYTRANDRAVKMGRRQLQSLFEQKFRESVSAASIEIGFPGEIIHKDRKIAVCDLAQLPSAVATAKLKQLIDIKSGMKSSGSTTMVARLTHARIFGTDSPYEDRSPDELAAEMRQIRQRYRNQDEYYLFEQHSQELQFVIYNQGDEIIRDASLSLVMPNHAAFYVASQLPRILQDDHFVDRTPAEQAEYPSVALSDDNVQVSSKLGDIESGELMEIFTAPLRVCVGTDLSGRRFGVQYSLFAKNLRAPACGKLRLLF
jgi:hypothetical protein